MNTPPRSIHQLIERSSLGTQSARAARRTVPPEQGRSMVERAAAKSSTDANRVRGRG